MNNENPADPGAPVRKWAYGLLIAVTAGLTGGRILSVQRLYEPNLYRPPGQLTDPRGNWPTVRPLPLPTHGDNDRSRWVTIRSLVEEGTYSIGQRVEYPALDEHRSLDERFSFIVHTATIG